MNIAEATNVNALIEFMLGVSVYGTDQSDEERAKEAAITLAERAGKALGAGVNGDWVRRNWSSRKIRRITRGRRTWSDRS